MLIALVVSTILTVLFGYDDKKQKEISSKEIPNEKNEAGETLGVIYIVNLVANSVSILPSK